MLLSVTMPAVAENPHPRGIVFDGTIGINEPLMLQGPNYQIEAHYGRQAGANLFHSFQQFNLERHETATFNGPDSVSSIIGRITGGNASWIEGTVRVSIPDASLYLINSAGIMIGADATLDIGGAFHVSAADYLQMGAEHKFSSLPAKNEVLVSEPPSAFGYYHDASRYERFNQDVHLNLKTPLNTNNSVMPVSMSENKNSRIFIENERVFAAISHQHLSDLDAGIDEMKNMQAQKNQPLPYEFLESDWAKSPCEAKERPETGRLTTEERNAIATPVDDWLPAVPPRLPDFKDSQSSSRKGSLNAPELFENNRMDKTHNPSPCLNNDCH